MDESLKNKAYLEGTRLKKSGLDNEVIYARLEKQGIPNELALQVIENISLQSEINQVKENDEKIQITKFTGLIRLLAAFLVAIASFFLFPNHLFIPAGCIIIGLVLALFPKLKV